MDSIKAEKLRAINSYKHNKSLHQFFYSLIVHSLIAITCSLICSYSYWFPSLYTIKHLLFMSLPNSFSSFFNPRCLFIVANFIVVFLIGESRLSGKQSPPATEMYQEYVERRRSLRRPPSTSTFQEKKEETVVPAMSLQNDDNAKRIEDEEVDQSKGDKHDDDHDEDFKECEENGEDKKDEGKKEKEDKQEEKEEEKEEEEEAGIPAQELNKRVEDFIARVNKQRWLEARFLVCR